MSKYKIVVTWFKESGKYYAEGEYYTQHEGMLEVIEEFRQMLARGKRPGLVDCTKHEFTAVLNCDGHPHGFPMMFPLATMPFVSPHLTRVWAGKETI